MRIEEPKYWVSLKTGNSFIWKNYAPIDEPKRGWLPLPKNEYPFTIKYEETSYGKWLKNLGK